MRRAHSFQALAGPKRTRCLNAGYRWGKLLLELQNHVSASCTNSRLFCNASNDFPGTSGGAIFHTGYLRIFSSTFVANKAGIEGPAVMSIGFLEEMSSVVFSENMYYCGAGKYGYIVNSEVSIV